MFSAEYSNLEIHFATGYKTTLINMSIWNILEKFSCFRSRLQFDIKLLYFRLPSIVGVCEGYLPDGKHKRCGSV